jgi:hypothetical protein
MFVGAKTFFDFFQRVVKSWLWDAGSRPMPGMNICESDLGVFVAKPPSHP